MKTGEVEDDDFLGDISDDSVPDSVRVSPWHLLALVFPPSLGLCVGGGGGGGGGGRGMWRL
jgi:hypothetical protein